MKSRSLLYALPLIACVFLAAIPASTQAQTESLIVTSRGIGTDPDSAKKDALINAMQQAVGSFIDGETVIENDEIIKDKILSVSDGFVESYDVVSGPSKRSDGLFEIQIKAIVKRGKMLARLKEYKVLKSDVAGKDVAAELITKISNIEQGEQLLEKNLDGLLEKLLVARLVDENGKAGDKIRPTSKILPNRQTQFQWNIEVYFDLKSFYEKVSPQLEKVFEAVADDSSGKVVCIGGRHLNHANAITNFPLLSLEGWYGNIPAVNSNEQIALLLSVGRDKWGTNERFRCYILNKNAYKNVFTKFGKSNDEVNLSFIALDSSGGVVHETVLPISSTFVVQKAFNNRTIELNYVAELSMQMKKNNFYTSGPADITEKLDSSNPNIISPRFSSKQGYDYEPYSSRNDGYSDTLMIPYVVTMDRDDMERIASVRFRFGK